MKKIAILVIISLMLVGWWKREGGKPETKAERMQGLYVGHGSTYGGLTSEVREIRGLLLENGAYYFLYNEVSDDGTFRPPNRGVVQGKGEFGDTGFASWDGKDFNLSTKKVTDPMVSAGYAKKQWLDGLFRVVNAPGTVMFQLHYDSDYEKQASLKKLAGKYSSLTFSSTPVSPIAIVVKLAVTEEGVVTLIDKDQEKLRMCDATGKVSPRLYGSVYDITLKFDDDWRQCIYKNQSLSGVLYSGKQGTWAILLTNDRSNVLVLDYFMKY